MKTKCPNDEILGDYMEGSLSDEGRLELEKHLGDCDLCLEGIMVARKLVRGGDPLELEPVPDRVTRAAVRLVSNRKPSGWNFLKEEMIRSVSHAHEWISNQLNTWKQPELSPIRSTRQIISKDLVQIRKMFEEIDTEIEIEKTGEDYSHIRVTLIGNINGEQGVRVTLKTGDREVSSHLLDGGRVVFEDIPFGHYSLVFGRDGSGLGTYHFEIKETPHGRR